nr:hypothetical protein [Tanacetum cinerariifolium]
MVTHLQKPEGNEGFHQILDFPNLSHISILDNEEMEITATIDRKVKVVTEASVRRQFKLEDSDEIQGRFDQDMVFNLDFDAAKEVFNAEKEVSTIEQVSTASAKVTTASIDVSPSSPTRRVSSADDITMAET